MELYPFINLAVQRLPGSAVSWVEGGIVPLGASSTPHRPSPDRTGEAGIDHHLLETLPVLLPVISGEIPVPLPHLRKGNHRTRPAPEDTFRYLSRASRK